MSARLCIGSRGGEVVAELPYACIDVLLDFVSAQEDADGSPYLATLKPLRRPAGDLPGSAAWSALPTWPGAQMLRALQLLSSLLAQHGALWERDPDWRAARMDAATLRRLLDTAQAASRKALRQELVVWVAP